jgi:hypothetical protein
MTRTLSFATGVFLAKISTLSYTALIHSTVTALKLYSYSLNHVFNLKLGCFAKRHNIITSKVVSDELLILSWTILKHAIVI